MPLLFRFPESLAEERIVRTRTENQPLQANNNKPQQLDRVKDMKIKKEKIPPK